MFILSLSLEKAFGRQIQMLLGRGLLFLWDADHMLPDTLLLMKMSPAKNHPVLPPDSRGNSEWKNQEMLLSCIHATLEDMWFEHRTGHIPLIPVKRRRKKRNLGDTTSTDRIALVHYLIFAQHQDFTLGSTLMAMFL